jgi:hypothetical protein
VNRGDSAPVVSSTAVGEQPCSTLTCSFSPVCSETWACSGIARWAAYSATSVIEAASTARTEWIAAPMRTPS